MRPKDLLIPRIDRTISSFASAILSTPVLSISTASAKADSAAKFPKNLNFKTNSEKEIKISINGNELIVKDKAYLQDINTCLKEEVIEGNLEKENYETFFMNEWEKLNSYGLGEIEEY